MFPDSVIRLADDKVCASNDVIQRSTPISARYSRTSCARNVKKFTRYSLRPRKRLRSSSFCVATPTGRCSGDICASLRNPVQSGTGGETEFFGSEHCHQYDVAACFELSVHLQHHLSAQAVQHQCLLRFAQTEFGRDAGIADG